MPNAPLSQSNAAAGDRTRRAAWLILGLAVLIYAGLTLYLSRGATFTFDDLVWLVESDGFRPGHVLEPHYGHLIAVSRLIYSTMLATVGPSELVIRLGVIVPVAATSVLLYALVSRRLGPLAALAPAIVVLFLGATPEPLLPSFAPFPLSTAFGLGALLVLERERRHADPIACVLLVLSVASLEIGLAFVAAAAALIAADRRRLARSWVVVVPVLLFAAWWLWARQFDESFARSTNLLLIPVFTSDSIAAATSALSGLGHMFLERPGSSLSIEWGRTLAPILLVVVIWQGFRRGVTRELGGFVVLTLTLCAGFAIGYGLLRTPDVDRYAYPVAIALVLVLAESFRGVEVTRKVLFALLLATLFALPANLYQLRESGTLDRENSALVDAEHVAYDIAREQVPADFDARIGLPDQTLAGQYFALVDEYGPIAGTPAELAAKEPWVRASADAILLRILEPELAAGPATLPSGCDSVPTDAAHTARFPLPPGGVILRSPEPGAVAITRFGDIEAPLPGALSPGRPATLELPADDVDPPWTASVATAASAVDVCPFSEGEAAP